MLYISRQVDWQDTAFGVVQKYGVVDTDDGVEEIVTRREILDLGKAGIDIMGGVQDRTGLLFPYQLVETFSAYQSRLSAIGGIDTAVYNGEITRITLGKSMSETTVRIILSKLGDRLGPYSLMYNDYEGPVKAVLVFDDSINVLKRSIIPHSLSTSCGIRYDLRRVTRSEVREAVYDELRYFMTLQGTFELVMDLPEYKIQMQNRPMCTKW